MAKRGRVGIVFSGGPAPGANAVISAAAMAFLDAGFEVLGFFHGFSNLQECHSGELKAEHYHKFTAGELQGIRNTRGILIGTARAHPGMGIEGPDDLRNQKKTRLLSNVHQTLLNLEVDALITIGGDGTLRTANYLHAYQKQLPDDVKRVRIVHIPKTIDNDYYGIDFTFGFFTAVDVMAKEIQNLRADAKATGSYFVVQTMGRRASWLPYGAAIAGEADLVIGLEDAAEQLTQEDGSVSLDRLAQRVVELIEAREEKGWFYGTVVLAEGLVELLSDTDKALLCQKENSRDPHGQLNLSKVDLGMAVAVRSAALYEERNQRKKKIADVKLGYESRSAPPHAFDVMLGSQLGIGAFRALVEEDLDGYMVSVEGQLALRYVPFSELINPQTLEAEVRFIERGSDFFRLARFLETRSDRDIGWHPSRRKED